MVTSLVVVFETVSIISFLLVGKTDQEQAYAQTQAINFTQLFSTDSYGNSD
jgi:formate hydrogenlyase subunit 3/multisubunit Na+/H+ antiporter MnhD subunit